MRHKVHYFSFYLSEEMEFKRDSYPASYTKIEYVKNVIIKSGAEIVLVSAALAKQGVGFLPQKVIEINESEKQVYLSTFSFKGKLFNKIKLLYMWIQMIKYVLFQVKETETLIIYHSLMFIQPFKLLRRLKKFKMILEFNDLYHVTKKELLSWKKKEISFIEMSDAYLFMNNIAEKRFNKGKPYILSYGNYELPKVLNNHFSHKKVHVLYAGIIENVRKAAQLAIQSALYLDQNYIIHLLGFGDNQDLKKINELIESVNKQKGYEAIIFHGRLRGQEFTDFLHSCHIGLSCHTYLPEELDSADFTFPSKIPTYMAHNLYVVSPDILCVKDSPFAEFTTFYTDHTPYALAQAIIKCNLKIRTNNSYKKTPSSLINEMDNDFIKAFKNVLKQ